MKSLFLSCDGFSNTVVLEKHPNDQQAEGLELLIDGERMGVIKATESVGLPLLLNINQVCDAGFESGALNWKSAGSEKKGTSFGVDFAEKWRLHNGHTLYIYQRANSDTGVELVYQDPAVGEFLPVSANECYQLAGSFGLHRCEAVFMVAFYDKQYAELQSFEIQLTGDKPGGQSLDGYLSVTERITAPKKSAFAKLIVKKHPAKLAESDSFLFFTRPFFALIAPDLAEPRQWEKSPVGIEDWRLIRQCDVKQVARVDFELPERVFDGKSHRIELIEKNTGNPIAGSPKTFVYDCYDGCVESISTEGIIGWATNLNRLGDVTGIDVLLGSHVLGTAYALKFRKDISEIMKRPMHCGFRFDWKKSVGLPKQAIDELRAASQSPVLSFRISGTDIYLKSSATAPGLDFIIERVGPPEAKPLSGSQKKRAIEAIENQKILPVAPADEAVKAIAFYLPQFHPIPENDEWWGPGFTEWTNVTQAKPLFPGHYQPHVPADLGYYDLRLPEVRNAQAELAKKYGIYGFCYYYYWFSGRRILERPLQDMLDSGTPDFPFCICWANENWSRRWDGSENEILLKQEHNAETDAKFINDVIPILRDPRYIRINGKPLLMVYRISLLPNPSETARIWRKICQDEGLGEIYLTAVESFGYTNPYKDGFDASVQFPPHGARVAGSANDLVDDLPEDYTGTLYDYQEVVFNDLNAEVPAYKRFRGVMCSWDNTARKKKAGNVFLNATPHDYELWLRGVADYTRQNLPAGERLVFINAWNEWAEGTHLEPDRKFGHGFLEATRRALGQHSDWRVLLELAERKESVSKTEIQEWAAELRQHLSGYEQSLRYLTKLHKPLMRDMANRAFFIDAAQCALGNGYLAIGGEADIEQLGSHKLENGFNDLVVDRDRCIYVLGWALAKGYHLHEHVINYFTLLRLSDRAQYFALSKPRYKRKDIAELNKEDYSNSEAVFSGFRTFLDFANVEPGEYRMGIVYVDSSADQLGNSANTVTYFKGRVTVV